MIKEKQFKSGIAAGMVVYQLSDEQLPSLASLIAEQVANRISGSDMVGVLVPASNDVEWGTRQQAADLATISLPTLHALIREGLVLTTKIGRRTSVNLTDLREKLAAGELAKYRRRSETLK